MPAGRATKPLRSNGSGSGRAASHLPNNGQNHEQGGKLDQSEEQSKHHAAFSFRIDATMRPTSCFDSGLPPYATECQLSSVAA